MVTEKFKKFLNLYSIQFLYSFGHVFAFSLLFLYLFKVGFSNLEIAVFSTLRFVSVVIILFFIKTVNFRKAITTGIVLKSFYLAAFACFIAGFEVIQLYVIAIITGIVIFIFWTPYNIRFFGFGNNGNNAFMGSIIFLLWPILNVFIPVTAGFLARDFGFAAVFLITATITLSSSVFVKRAGKDEPLPFDIKKTLRNSDGVRTLNMLEGIFEGIMWTAVPLATISFITSEVDYGIFFSFLGLFGALAAVVLARMSDRMKKRTIFIYPTVILLGISTILAAFSNTLILWAIANAAIAFVWALVSPFQVAIVLDKSKNLVDSMAAREFFMNLGRFFGGIIAITSLLLFGLSEYSLVVAGIAMLLYAVVIHLKKLYFEVATKR
ncbi:MAG: hypothetical protein KAI53_03285 [Candidatus Aenigmarchaeota archaeon]|nr:hypothetical protein [Candidatus Aenigmarchaeota archaeon]